MSKHKILYLAFGIVIVLVLTYHLYRMVFDVRIGFKDVAAMNRLRQISLALDNYFNIHKCYPPAFTLNSDGEPQHNWTAFLSPFLLDNRSEYYRWNNSWEENASTINHSKAPESLRCLSDFENNYPSDWTFFTIIIPQNYDSKATSTTKPIIVENAKTASHWLKPNFICLEDIFGGMDENSACGLGGVHKNIIIILAADGNVYKVSDSISCKNFLSLTK